MVWVGWWFGSCVTGLLKAVWQISSRGCFCDPLLLLLQPSRVNVSLTLLGSMSNFRSVWGISCKKNKHTELLSSVAEMLVCAVVI